MDFDALLREVMPSGRKRLALAAAEDGVVLRAVCEAYKLGFVSPILCGNAAGIKTAAQEAGLDINSFEMEAADTPEACAEAAVRLVREGRADMLMKGMLQTATLLRAVLNKEKGLRGAGVLSHVSILHSPILERRILLTDAAMVPYPDMKTKAQLIGNAVQAAQALGVRMPKVAVLAAVEVINPDMPATLDAAALTQMNRRGQLSGCIVDGPLAMDLALSQEAALHKGVKSDVAGHADILLLPNIDAANAVLKTFTHAGGCLFGGVIMGAAAPIVLTSRSDTAQSKLYSIACAAAIAGGEDSL